jgi:hypothetical protein
MRLPSTRIAGEKQADADCSRAPRPEWASGKRVEELLSITRKLFSEPIKVVEEEDPEIEGERYFAFHVAVSGSPREVIDRQRQWHRSVIACAGDEARPFRLALHVND